MSEMLLSPSLSPAEVRLIEQTCDRFEAAWKAGQPPHLEAYLGTAEGPLRGILLGQLLMLDWEYRLRAGDRPRAADYEARFPDAGALIEAVGREVAAAAAAQTRPGPCSPAAAQTRPGAGSPTAAGGPVPARLGDYRIVREVGRGGMGVVYEAVQEPLGRRVALKVLPGPSRSDPMLRERFRREAAATARLQHPNIVQIFEVSEQDGQPFLALEFIAGPSLADLLREASQPPRQAAVLVETLARAMHHAHAHGIVHRDLKPANVLLSRGTGVPPVALAPPQAGRLCHELAEYTPKVTDFGLAHPVAGADLTATGDIVGTPGYMAPEQAWGKCKQRPVGPAADVYALGAILYECLTGRPPFKAATPLDTVMLVVSEEPVPPARLQPGVPRDLETICLKCLEKEPPRRYATAADLAEDLRRFQAGESITARPAGRLERALKWARRRPAAAALLGVSAAAAAVVLGVVVAFSAALVERNRDLERSLELQQRAEATARLKAQEAGVREDEALSARKAAEEEKKKAVKAAVLAQHQRDQARSHLFTAQLLKVGAVYATDPKQGLELLREYDACPIDLRDAAWHYYDHTCRGKKPVTLAEGGVSRVTASVAFSPDGKTLASAGSGKDVDLWEVATGKKHATLRGSNGNVLCVAFRPDGKTLALGGEDGTIRLWDVATGKEHAVFTGHGSGVFSVAFSPDGQALASVAFNDKTVRLWDVATGKEHRTLQLPSGFARFVAFSPDGKTLASGDSSSAVHLWDVAAGRERAVLRHVNGVSFGAFSQDGHTLATAGVDRTVRLWDVAAGRERVALKHAGIVWSVAFSRDGRTLATGDGSGAVRLWEADTGKERATLRHAAVAAGKGRPVLRPPGAVASVAFSPDGHLLASAGIDGTARLWEVATGQERTALQAHAGGVWSVAFSPDGRTLGSGGDDGTARLWEVATGKELAVLAGRASLPVSVAFSPDGKTLASTWSVLDGQKKPPQQNSWVKAGSGRAPSR